MIELLEKPIMSEKAGVLRDEANKYVFRVSKRAKKDQIKRAVERMFDVKVMRVNSLIMRGQIKKRGVQGMFSAKQPNFKKAYVTLHKGQKITLFEDN